MQLLVLTQVSFDPTYDHASVDYMKCVHTKYGQVRCGYMTRQKTLEFLHNLGHKA